MLCAWWNWAILFIYFIIWMEYVSSTWLRFGLLTIMVELFPGRLVLVCIHRNLEHWYALQKVSKTLVLDFKDPLLVLLLNSQSIHIYWHAYLKGEHILIFSKLIVSVCLYCSISLIFTYLFRSFCRVLFVTGFWPKVFFVWSVLSFSFCCKNV